MSITAKVIFNRIPRPQYNYRYFGKSNWARLYNEHSANIACCFNFIDSKEYFDGESAEVELEFFEDEQAAKFLTLGSAFTLNILDLEIAQGVIVELPDGLN